jgi:hypothetical protein
VNGIDLDECREFVKKRYDNENFRGMCLGNNGEKIKLITADDMNLENIGFIHVDAQGSENFIFSKALETINKNKPVIYYENNKTNCKYLFDTVCNNYPSFENESKFDIMEYCMKVLNYSNYITYFNGSMDTLLIP